MELVWQEDGATRRVPIGPSNQEILVGRLQLCEIRASLPTLSRRHARFSWVDGQVQVTDLGSTAGTFIDGDKIREQVVVPGTTVNCGGLFVTLEGGAAPELLPEQAPAVPQLPDLPEDDATPGFDAGAFFAGTPVLEPPPTTAPEPTPEPVAPSAPEPSAREHMTAYLYYEDEEGQTHGVRIARDGDPMMIGRRSSATIKVRNPSVSGTHCTVGWVGDVIEVRDLGSSNGTYINGERVRRGYLNDSDILRCGTFELRVHLVAHQDLAAVEYEEWGDDWGEDEFDPGQPRYHVVYRDSRGDLAVVTLGPNEPRLAVGSRGCEIHIEGRDVEAEHAEFEWDDGALIIKDLDSETGSFVNDAQVVDEELLRNGDVVVVGRARLRIVRGTSEDMTAPEPTRRSEAANAWARHLDHRDDDLEFLFIDGETDDDGGRQELSIWGNGECRLERFTAEEHFSHIGMIERDLILALMRALVLAGFPDAKKTDPRDGEVPAHLTLFQDRDEGALTLTKRLAQRSPSYHEVVELLRAVSIELSLP